MTDLSQTQTSLPAGLYLVATPIGNLRDITLRALDVLRAADIVLCEDTRVTAKLLQAHGIKTKTRAYHEHNADRIRPQITKEITKGQAIALVSDAGTPLVSDPGYKLVKACREQGLYVTSCPGANAPLTALQLSALPSDSFAFIGFPPTKSGARTALFKNWQNVPGTLIFFERASRLADTLTAMIDIFGDREGAIVREITKKFEETRQAPLSALKKSVEDDPPRGEIVLLVAGLEKDKKTDPAAVTDMLNDALETMSVRDAAAYVSEATGLPKKAIYEQALSLNKNHSGES